MTKIDRHFLTMVPISILALLAALCLFLYNFPVWRMLSSLLGCLIIFFFLLIFVGVGYRTGAACYDWIRIHTGKLIHRDLLRMQFPAGWTYSIPAPYSNKYRMVIFFDNVGAKCIQGAMVLLSPDESRSKLVMELQKYRSSPMLYEFFESIRFSAKNSEINKIPYIIDFSVDVISSENIISLNLDWNSSRLRYGNDEVPTDGIADIELLLLAHSDS